MSREEREILCHAEELAAEMNLRLFLDRELCDGEQILFVESIKVTEISYPKTEKKTAFVQQVKESKKESIWSRVHRFFTHIRK